MTKYVIQSGGIRNQPELKKQFHQELVKGLGNKPKFLLCNFAQPREYWEQKFPGYANAIAEDMHEGVAPSFTLAMPDEFAEQCNAADIIYCHGGDDHLVQYWMRKFDLPTLFKDKVVATNSGSSDMLVMHYWTCDWRKCGDGLGIVPIKFIPHHQSNYGADDPRGPVDWEKAKDALAMYGDTSLPLYGLKEGEFVVLKQ